MSYHWESGTHSLGFWSYIEGRRDAQAIFCRRRHQPRRPPLAKIRPGRPAPAIGPGNAIAVPKAKACWP